MLFSIFIYDFKLASCDLPGCCIEYLSLNKNELSVYHDKLDYSSKTIADDKLFVYDDFKNVLNSVAFNIARIIGPAIAGILMGKYGVTSCFVINAISYLIVFISILRLDTNEEIEKKEKMSFTSILSETKSGFIHILENKKLFNIY